MYLHEGKLYVIAPGESLVGHGPRCPSKSQQPEYAWLCSSCCFCLTIEVDDELGTRVVRKLEARNGSKFATSSNDRTKIKIA